MDSDAARRTPCLQLYVPGCAAHHGGIGARIGSVSLLTPEWSISVAAPAGDGPINTGERQANSVPLRKGVRRIVKPHAYPIASVNRQRPGKLVAVAVGEVQLQAYGRIGTERLG